MASRTASTGRDEITNKDKRCMLVLLEHCLQLQKKTAWAVFTTQAVKPLPDTYLTGHESAIEHVGEEVQQDEKRAAVIESGDEEKGDSLKQEIKR